MTNGGVDNQPDLRDLYGNCLIASIGCSCLLPGTGWKGRGCPNWIPLGPRTQEELKTHQLAAMAKLIDARKQKKK